LQIMPIPTYTEK